MIDDFQQHLQQAKSLLVKHSGSFFWGGAERGRAVEQISHLVNFSQLLLLVTGSIGSGKTHTLKQAERALHESCRCCFIAATPMMNASQLFSQLWKSLVDQTLPSSANTPDAFLFAVRDTLSTEQQAVVLIDDAILLDVDALRLLVTLATKAHEHSLPVHFVASGSESLANKMQQSHKLSQADLLYTIHLGELTLEDTIDYLRQYLKVTATEEAKELTTTDLDKIHKQAGGNFSKLNMLVDEVLARKMDISEPSKLGLPKGHLYAIGIVAGSLLLLLLINTLFFTETTDTDPSKTPLTTKTNTVEIPLWDEEVIVTKPELPVIETSIIEAPKTTNRGDSNKPVLPSQITESVVENTVITIKNTSEVVNDKGSAQLVEKKLQKDESNRTQQELSKKQAAPEKIVVENKGSNRSSPIPQARSEQTKKPIKTVKKTAQTSAARYVGDVNWYLKQPKSSFVLQVLGVSSNSGAKKFITKHQAAGSLKYFTAQLKGKPWYVVTIGLYPNRDAALVAARQLPSKIRQQKPWPRSIANVQAEIRKNR